VQVSDAPPTPIAWPSSAPEDGYHDGLRAAHGVFNSLLAAVLLNLTLAGAVMTLIELL